MHRAIVFTAIAGFSVSSVYQMSGETFGTARVTAKIAVSGDHVAGIAFEDPATHALLPQGELFRLKMQDGHELAASTMRLSAAPVVTTIQAEPNASRGAAHLAGRQMCAEMRGADSTLAVKWCLIARGDEPYLRQEVTLSAGQHPAALADVQLIHLRDSAAHVLGTVAGSPIVAGDFYMGTEQPLSYSSADHGEVISGVKRTLPLGAGQSITYSSVVGVVRSGQLRRDFLAYVEMERAHPYRTFLHYNTWYDLGTGTTFSAADVLNRMNTFGTELVRKRGVTMDSFLMDDGWDNPNSLWRFNSGFPDGFVPLRATAEKYGFGLGVWVSPLGGYEEKAQRIAYGTAHGYEIVDGGYALSGPKYYAEFERTCLDFITHDGVNQFKIDGTGNVNSVFPGSIYDSDFAAAIHLIERMRAQSSQLFINLTTGTWPSPFWLRYADSIWRAGEDHDFSGEGTWRQRWMNYRDAQTYANIVKKGPLFPLNSLMLHGIIYAKDAEHLSDDPGNDFADEVHSFFGSGTALQELYLTPSLLSTANWDVLAEGARWSRQNAGTLMDTHWVGGDPGKGEVYGWASWSAQKAVLALRNPTSHPQSIRLDAQRIFELTGTAPQRYMMHSPWKAEAAQPAVELHAGEGHEFRLAPFQVITLETHAGQ